MDSDLPPADSTYPFDPKDCPHQLRESPHRMGFGPDGEPIIEDTGPTRCKQCGSEFLAGEGF